MCPPPPSVCASNTNRVATERRTIFLLHTLGSPVSCAAAVQTEELTAQRDDLVEALARDIGEVPGACTAVCVCREHGARSESLLSQTDAVWAMEGIHLVNAPPDDFQFDMEVLLICCIHGCTGLA